MSRRIGRRKARGSGRRRSAAQKLYGATAFNDTNSMATAGDGIIGSATTGLNLELLVTWNAVPATTQYITSRAAGFAGWGFLQLSADLYFFVTDGAAVFNSPGRTIVAGDLNKVHRISGVWDTAGVVRLYFNGVEVGSGTAAATYSPLGAGTRTPLGLRSNGASSFTSGTLYGMQGGNQVATAAEIAAAWAADKANATLTAIASKTEKRWLVSNGGTPSSVPSTINDTIGGDNVTTFNGTGAAGLTLVTNTSVVWG